MKIKTKLILNRVITSVLAVLFIFAGYFNSDMLMIMGVAMLFGTFARLVSLIPILRDEEKLRKYEVACKDERNVYLAQKSYSWSFWISVYLEFAALCVLSFLNMSEYAEIFSYIICIQLIVYVILRYVFNKKY